MNDTSMMIAIEEAKIAAQRANGDIVDRLRAAMVEVKDHWMVTSEEGRFKSAVGGVMMLYGEDSPEYERLRREMQDIGKLSALINASQAGLSVSLESLAGMVDDLDEYQPLGLMHIWREVKKGVTQVKRFRRKPLEITAVQVLSRQAVQISSGETMTAKVGDWIITSESGARWVCEKDIFPQLYEAIE